jgi:hypothetical protein
LQCNISLSESFPQNRFSLSIWSSSCARLLGASGVKPAGDCSHLRPAIAGTISTSPSTIDGANRRDRRVVASSGTRPEDAASPRNQDAARKIAAR